MRRNLLQRESCSIETKLFTAHKLNATDLTCNKSDQLYWSLASASRLDWLQRNLDGWCSVQFVCCKRCLTLFSVKQLLRHSISVSESAVTALRLIYFDGYVAAVIPEDTRAGHPSTPDYTRKHSSTPKHIREHSGTSEHTRKHSRIAEHTRIHTKTFKHTRAHPSTPGNTRVHPRTPICRDVSKTIFARPRPRPQTSRPTPPMERR